MKAGGASFIKQVLRGFLLAAALLVLGCGTAATATPGAATPVPGATVPPAPRVSETTLRVGVPFLSQQSDPVIGGFLSIRHGLAETLFKLDKNLKPEPWLATAARQVDEKIWEITLRQGVKFHDGALMDAPAVKASLERATAKSPTAKALLDVARIDVKDPLSLTITTNNPNLVLPGMLTDPTTSIVNAAAAEAMGDVFAEKPVLTGPFKVDQVQQDKELVAARHSEYWGGPPPVDRVIFSYVPDNSSRVLALQSGDIDVAFQINPESATTVTSDPNLLVKTGAPTNLVFMHINHRREPWKDAMVRQAIASAIDREALVKGVMEGIGAPANGPFPPTMLSCNQLREHPFDPAKAKQLLTQAGYQDKDGDGYVEKDGQTLSMTLLTYRQQAPLPAIAEVIQAGLKNIGIKANIRIAEAPIAAIQQGDWDGSIWLRNTVTTGDPYYTLYEWFTAGGSANFGGYSDPRVAALARQVGQASGRQTRERLACDASQFIVDEVVVVPLLYESIIYGVSGKVFGFDEPHPFFLYFMDNKIGKH
jgi:peptide/nickel transport system substrate-binding protein